MTQTQIDGGFQIKSGTVTTTQLASSAGITDGQLATSYVKADGTRAFTGEVAGVDPTSSTHLATKNYVDAKANGLTLKQAVQAATTGSETYTVASGSVTQINGTTLDGISVAIGDRVLVKDAPSASGTGSAGSDQPGNGIYTVSGNTTNLTVSRATDLSGTNNPAGATTYVEAGTVAKGYSYGVIDPTTPDTAYTYGTTTMQWSLIHGFTGVTTVSVATANGIQGSVANASTTPAITLQTSLGAGVIKSNGSNAFALATAGTDYMAPADFVTRETPTGSINGSNTTYTLANTPLAGTEMVFLNGVLQEPGAGNDYTISGGTITYLTAPLSGARLRVTYQK